MATTTVGKRITGRLLLVIALQCGLLLVLLLLLLLVLLRMMGVSLHGAGLPLGVPAVLATQRRTAVELLPLLLHALEFIVN